MRREQLDWALCFASLTMLLLNQWTIELGYSGLPMIDILLFLAPWAWIFLRQPTIAVHTIVLNWPLFALPGLALISTLWSNFPAWSARAAVQFLITSAVGVMAGSCIKPRQFVAALLCALALVALLSAVSGRSVGALIGLFGSKNYLALCVSILFFAAVFVIFDRFQPWPFRLIGIISALGTPVLLILAESVGAIVVTIVTSLVVFLIQLGFRLLPRFRAILIILATLALFMFLLIASLNLDQFQNGLSYLGKDVTLTGRTYLWEFATESIMENPILGVGYQAYWQIGNPDAEHLWQVAGIFNKAGFHFHNAYLQVAVDLGLFGLFIFVATLVTILVRLLYAVLRPLPKSEHVFAMTIFIFLLLRTPIEVDLFFQFQITSILLCVIWVYLRQLRSSVVAAHSSLTRGRPAQSLGM